MQVLGNVLAEGLKANPRQEDGGENLCLPTVDLRVAARSPARPMRILVEENFGRMSSEHKRHQEAAGLREQN